MYVLDLWDETELMSHDRLTYCGKVPLNWIDPDEAQRVILAVIKLNATETEDYRGSVLINPGVRWMIAVHKSPC